MLEDHRSKSEQEQIFVKRWISLINSLSSDSLKLASLLYNVDNSGLINPNHGIYSWMRQDSVFIEEYDYLIQIGKLRSIIEVLTKQRYWALSWTEQSPYYQEVIENHPDLYLEVCRENPQICEWLDLYAQYHERIDRYNRYARDKHISYWDKISDSYRLPPKITAYSDSFALAKDVQVYSTHPGVNVGA